MADFLGESTDPAAEAAANLARLSQLFDRHKFAGCGPIDDYEKIIAAGRGATGSVFKSKNKRTGQIVAVKNLKDLPSEEVPLTVYTEIRLLKKMDHENVVKLLDIVVGNDLNCLALVMEYCDDALNEVMTAMSIPFSQRETKCILTQLFSGLAYIHKHEVIHRDISPSNLLINDCGVLKIADFGSAKDDKVATTPSVGTRWYMAPEFLFEVKSYTSAVDMWSAGCIFGELLKHTPLFPGGSEMEQIVLITALLGTPNDQVMPGFSSLPSMQFLELKSQPYNIIRREFPGLPDSGVQLFKKLLLYNPINRAKASWCLEHDYFKETPAACPPSALRLGIVQKIPQDCF